MKAERLDYQKLDRINQGVNFLNLKEKSKKDKFYIRVEMTQEINLKGRESKVRVNSNLPIVYEEDYYGWRGKSVEEFLEGLKNLMKMPIGEVRKTLRKIEVSRYYGDGFGDLKESLRTGTLDFDEIDIEVGELAEKELNKKGIDFVEEVKQILNTQDREYNIETQKKVDMFVRLREKIAVFKNLLVSESSSDYYGYGRREERDDTIKITLTDEEYNEKLKEIEKQIRTIEKDLGLKPYEFEYKEKGKELEDDYDYEDDDEDFDDDDEE